MVNNMWRESYMERIFLEVLCCEESRFGCLYVNGFKTGKTHYLHTGATSITFVQQAGEIHSPFQLFRTCNYTLWCLINRCSSVSCIATLVVVRDLRIMYLGWPEIHLLDLSFLWGYDVDTEEIGFDCFQFLFGIGQSRSWLPWFVWFFCKFDRVAYIWRS